MHISTHLRSALFVAAALASSHLQAATVPDPVTSGSAHELFLGFRATGGTGASSSYLVKLGAASSFSATSGTAFDLTGIGNLGPDLVALYGANWNTRADLFWGVFGTSTSASSTVYGSRERLSAGIHTDPWPALTASERNSVDSAITSVLNGIGGYKGSSSTANSSVATIQANASAASSYAFQVGTAGTSDFGSLSQWTSIEGDFGSGTAGTVLDVWRNSTSGVSYRGAFTINDSGVVRYTFIPVPEPSVSLLLVVAGAATCGLRRKRLVAQP